MKGFAAAARQHDSACDCCGPHAEPEPASQAPSLAWRREYRRFAGRSEGTHSYFRADTGRMESVPSRMVDPILLLASYRRHARRAGYGAMHYGELLQTVVSPVHLPDLRKRDDRADFAELMAAHGDLLTLIPYPINPTEPEADRGFPVTSDEE